ncbi:sugar phosphate isomerase/epimerase family protein [Candidatus Solincola sp.]|jgi:sugar phosphate isomerase/epimerase|nr:sugar phosphate isomerase/epimerase [Actinomycetota bacterium]MDI7251287.1 sugar phosphate isomerase/epimerase [Actinomycetota bacterium]
MGIDFIFSTASLFQWELERIFNLAGEAGFSGVELMVTKRPETQSPKEVRRLAEKYGLSVDCVHAPFLMAARKVWGDYRGKIEHSLEMARRLGAGVVVAHLPYFWQWQYARWVRRDLKSDRERGGVCLALENAMLLKLRRPLNFSFYNSLPTLARFPHLVFDTSHFAIAGVDIFRAWDILGERVRHVHLSNNYLKGFDDHALPFDGRLPLDRFLKLLSTTGYRGKVSLELGPGPLEARLGERRVLSNLRRSLEFCLESV